MKESKVPGGIRILDGEGLPSTCNPKQSATDAPCLYIRSDHFNTQLNENTF